MRTFNNSRYCHAIYLKFRDLLSIFLAKLLPETKASIPRSKEIDFYIAVPFLSYYCCQALSDKEKPLITEIMNFIIELLAFQNRYLTQRPMLPII